MMWYTKGAEAGLPLAMYNVDVVLDKGQGVAAPGHPAAADWYRRAADAGFGQAAINLSSMYSVGRGRAWHMMPSSTMMPACPHRLDPRFSTSRASHDVVRITCQALGRGVTRSKRRVVQWLRKAAESGDSPACSVLANSVYIDLPYAQEVGHVGEAAGVAPSAGFMEGHDVPRDVLTGVVHWLRKGGHDIVANLDTLRRTALQGSKFCRNEGCEVVGHLKEFKVCPQCKTARYGSDACQKQDWTTGGHKTTCGTFHVRDSTILNSRY